MTKLKLESFIKKYSMGSSVESVIISSDKNDIITPFKTDDSSVLGVVKGKNFKLDEFEIGINDTSKLKTLLGVLSSEIEFNLNKENDTSVSVTLSDDETKVVFMLADKSVIKAVPKMKALPDFDVVIPLTKEFISKFIKAKSALPEVDTFTLIMDKKGKLNFVIGYTAGINSNCITLNISPEAGKDTLSSSMSFSAKYFKEILSANSEVEESVLYVSSRGLAKIEFNTDDFESTYYLTQIKMS